MLLELGLEAEKAAIRQRSEVPDDFDGELGVAVLDRRHVREVVVPLRGIIVQPADDLEDASRIDVDGRLAPHDIHALHRRAEALAQRHRRRIRRAAAMGNLLRSDGRALDGGAARVHGNDRSSHRADRVWDTELPKGSEISSIACGGM